MSLIRALIDFILHIDTHLAAIVAQFGVWTYALLFAIIFCETGLVVTPFLPGDSLLFAAGAFAAVDTLKIQWIWILLCLAAVLGDNVNYWVGRTLKERVLSGDKIRFIKKEYIDRTHKFFERHGGNAVILGRFSPIIRTFMPFIAGVASMRYAKFFVYDLIGGIAWISLFTFGGYFFGNLPVIKSHFSLAVLAIIVISLVPLAIEILRARREPDGLTE